jgi:hypothetical protein
MRETIEFYHRAAGPLGEEQDRYRLVLPDDDSPAVVEHEWFRQTAKKMSWGRKAVSIERFLSGRYDESAKRGFFLLARQDRRTPIGQKAPG